MVFISNIDELCELEKQAEQEALLWQEDYPEFQRLMDNGLLEDFDEYLPEVNDGSLAAALFKLPKRIVNTNLTGRAKAKNRDEAWITELANIEWENEIIPNAKTQAPFHRKWKDAVRKAAGFGSVPIITLFVEKDNYTGADFVVAQPQDVKLEAGAVSDDDSDLFFWDTYYSKKKVEELLERAKEESAEASEEDGYSKWNIPAIEAILASFAEEDNNNQNKLRSSSNKPKQHGEHFTVVRQRGVGAPFFLIHKKSKQWIREYSNPDPSGDPGVHFLYCYQDFENPYGIGIVKLAGGTQNVLDYMRKADVLATQMGFRPPISVRGDTTGLDLDSLVYAQDAIWQEGNAQVERREISNQIYSQLPNRMEMYKGSLNQLIPMGDTSISSTAGDPLASKTPAGVKMAQANLSIDDDDFKDNLYITYELVAQSMINTHFANMQGNDLRKLSDEDRDLLAKAGLEFPLDEGADPSNELDVIWDNARAEFTFEIDAEQDKTRDEEKRLEGLMRVFEISQTDPMIEQKLLQAGYRMNPGELMAEIISLTSDNDKILEQVSPEDQQMMQQQMEMQGQMGAQPTEQPMGQEQPMEQPQQPDQDLVASTMEQYGVDESTALFMLEAASQGFSNKEIAAAVERGATNVQG